MFRSMKKFDALDTIITLFSLMNQAVYFQSSSKAKCLIASCACVIFNHCGLTCELSSTPPDGISYCIQHNCPAFFHYVSACDPLGGGFAWFPYCIQLFYRFSPLWVIMWPFRCQVRLKDVWHLCCFYPLWIRKCRFRLPAWVKALLHWAQLYDFSPLCVKRFIYT